MKTALIVNPVSGHGRSVSLLPDVAEWSRKQGVEFKLYTTSASGDGIRLARLAALDGAERVVVLGGDGTINEVGQALAGTQVGLGVLPGGSGNDFLKMLTQKRDIETALTTAFRGNLYPIDVGSVNGKPFLNAVGVGFDAEVAARAAEQKSPAGFPGYLLAVFRVWRAFRPFELEIELDQLKLTQTVTLVCVGNGRSTGGGFHLNPTARLDDGLLDVCIIQALPKAKIFAYLPRALKGTHVRLEGVRLYRSRRIVIRSKADFPVHLDGEVMPPIGKLEIVLDSRKIKVAADDKFHEA
jgi:YegS/Rv2252/BmrU family lipid kinase